MRMHVVLFVIVLLAVIIGPGLWVTSVMKRYHYPPNRYSKTGGEAARELLDAVALPDVRTEVTDGGDHYDPRDKTVRLSKANFHGRSLTALTVAAHEVGHAIQDADGFPPLRWRTQLVRWVGPIEKVGAGMMMLAPIAAAAMRAPRLGMLAFLGGMLVLASGVLVHALTLPMEFDASFRRALPLVQARGLLREEDLPRAQKLLTAAALTYVSGALQSLLNIARWWAILRR
jgi:Zn-dependent membrane protease YugP